MDTTVTETQPTTWGLSWGEYTATVEKIAAINERAAKKGFTGRLEVVAERVEETHTNEFTGLQHTEVVYRTRVTGEAPSYGGWTFLARVDRVGESFTINTAPGVEHVDRSLVNPGACDHCGFDRRRNNTYLVRNDETGQVVNVGSTCIKDFLGWTGSVTFFADSDIEPVEGGVYYVPTYSVDTVIATAYAAIKAHGWMPASSYGRTTRDLVSLALMTSRLSEQERPLVEALRAHAAEATEMVTKVKDYILSDEFNGTSTYVDNLKVVVAADAVNGRQFGLLASAPQAYLRHLGQVAERKAQAAKTSGSEWVGAEKDKVEVTGTIEAVQPIAGDYGTSLLYTILGQDGNLYKWFSSNWALGEDTGVEVHIRGTVKKHDEFNGTKSTVLTRCKSI